MKAFYFKSENSNGGRISSVPIISGKRNDLFPSVRAGQARTGIIDYQKVFIKQESALPYRIAYIDNPDSDIIDLSICKATDSDIVADAESCSAWKGCGILQAGLSAGPIASISVSCIVPGGGFSALDRALLLNGENIEYVRIKSVSWSGKIATLTLLNGEQIANDYPLGAKIFNCIEYGTGVDMALWVKRQVLKDSKYSVINKPAIKVLL